MPTAGFPKTARHRSDNLRSQLGVDGCQLAGPFNDSLLQFLMCAMQRFLRSLPLGRLGFGPPARAMELRLQDANRSAGHEEEDDVDRTGEGLKRPAPRWREEGIARQTRPQPGGQEARPQTAIPATDDNGADKGQKHPRAFFKGWVQQPTDEEGHHGTQEGEAVPAHGGGPGYCHTSGLQCPCGGHLGRDRPRRTPRLRGRHAG